MKGTKLRRHAGSPLISGSSRWHRPFWRDWMLAALLAFAVAFVVIVGAAVLLGTGLETALRFAWLPAVPGAALGAVLGVWFAGKWGWLRRWPAGACLGVLAALAIAYVLPTYLISRLNG